MYDDREVFPSAPLEFVAAEVRFPFAPQLSKEETFDSLTESLRDTFPLTNREERPQGVEITQEGVKPVAAHTLWRFADRRRTASASITPTMFALETTDYAEYSQFRELLRKGLSAVAALNAVVGVERIGLRYIDELRVPRVITRPQDWFDYVRAELLAPLSALDDFTPEAVEGAVRFASGDGRALTMRYASLNGPGVVGQTGPLRRRTNPQPGPFFVVDIDSFWESKDEAVPDFAENEVLETFDDLHAPVGVLFLRVITEKFKNEVARKVRSSAYES